MACRQWWLQDCWVTFNQMSCRQTILSHRARLPDTEHHTIHFYAKTDGFITEQWDFQQLLRVPGYVLSQRCWQRSLSYQQCHCLKSRIPCRTTNRGCLMETVNYRKESACIIHFLKKLLSNELRSNKLWQTIVSQTIAQGYSGLAMPWKQNRSHSCKPNMVIATLPRNVALKKDVIFQPAALSTPFIINPHH